MKKLIIACVILMLAACSMSSEQKEAVPEHPAEKEVVPAAEPSPVVAPAPQPVAKENVSVVPDESMNETQNESAPVIGQLSLADQTRHLPEVGKAVNASDCYQLSWADIGNYTAKNPISVDRQVRYQYVSGLKWKGWITFRLYYSRKIMDTESVALIVDNGKVTCSQTEPFQIDWRDAFERMSTR